MSIEDTESMERPTKSIMPTSISVWLIQIKKSMKSSIKVNHIDLKVCIVDQDEAQHDKCSDAHRHSREQSHGK